MWETIINGAVTLVCAFVGVIGGLRVNSYRLTQIEKRVESDEAKNEKEHDEFYGKISTHGEEIAALKAKG